MVANGWIGEWSQELVFCTPLTCSAPAEGYPQAVKNSCYAKATNLAMDPLRSLTPGGGCCATSRPIRGGPKLTHLHRNADYSEASSLEADWQTAFFGANYPELLAIKQKWDPANILSHLSHLLVGLDGGDVPWRLVCLSASNFTLVNPTCSPRTPLELVSTAMFSSLLSRPSVSVTVEQEMIFVRPPDRESGIASDDPELRGTVLLSLPAPRAVRSRISGDLERSGCVSRQRVVGPGELDLFTGDERATRCDRDLWVARSQVHT